MAIGLMPVCSGFFHIPIRKESVSKCGKGKFPVSILTAIVQSALGKYLHFLKHCLMARLFQLVGPTALSSLLIFILRTETTMEVQVVLKATMELKIRLQVL